MTLTENQQNILNHILAGAITADQIAERSGLAKSSITPVLVSLVKKEVITKNEDGTYNLIPADRQSPIPDQQSSIDNTITLLIPYISSPFKGAELKAALRAWAMHFQGDLKVVIVGDREDWFSDKIVHIPTEPYHTAADCGGCITPTIELNPQADVVHKIVTAIATGEVQGDFILSNDDIFLLGPTYLEELKVLRYRGNLTTPVGSASGLYRVNGVRTLQALHNAKLPTLNYGTHTPVVLNSDRVLDIVEKYKATEKAYLFTSLYFNTLYPLARPIYTPGDKTCQINASVYRPLVASDDRALIDHIFQYRKFINTNDKGWPYLEPIFQRLFDRASPYEY